MKISAIKKEDVFFSANILSFTRFFIAIAVFYFILSGMNYSALLFYATAMGTDMLDGYLARKHGRLTSLGYYLDAYADNTLIALSMLGLLISGRIGPFDFLGYIIIVSITTSGFYISKNKDIFYAAFKKARMKQVGGLAIMLIIILGILDIPYFSPYFTGGAFLILLMTSSIFLHAVLSSNKQKA